MRRTVAIVVTVGLLAGSLSACTKDAGVSVEPNLGAASSGDHIPDFGIVKVRRGDLAITLSLDGAVEASPRIRLAPSDAFTIDAKMTAGAVSRGRVIGKRIVAPELAEQLAESDSSIDRARLSQLRSGEGSVSAPVRGTLSKDGLSLEAPGLDVVAALTPLQYLRFTSGVFTGRAEVESVTGVRTVQCEALWLSETVIDEGAEQGLRCRVPGHIETAPGLRASLTLMSATVPDATLVPNLYLTYDEDAQTYEVKLRENGVIRTVPVEVGMSDGVLRAIESPLPEGAELVLPSLPGTGTDPGPLTDSDD